MILTDLTALTTLLCGAKEREKRNQASPAEHLNPYLVYHVVLPFLAGQDIFLEDICYDEFEPEDLEPTADFFYYNWPDGYYSCVLADGAASLPAQAQKTKQFC